MSTLHNALKMHGMSDDEINFVVEDMDFDSDHEYQKTIRKRKHIEDDVLQRLNRISYQNRRETD